VLTTFSKVQPVCKHGRDESRPYGNAPRPPGTQFIATCSTRRSWRRASGFTLIELLVVIVIIGIILSVATLSIGVLGRDNESEDQAKRLNAVLGEVREEAELQGKDLGLLIERDGYLFMRFNYSSNTWQELTGDDLTDYRKLPDGLQMRLWLEGREVIVKSHNENQLLLAQSSSSASSQSAVNGPLDNAAVNTVVPQIALLSSGDLSPFELRIQREGSDFAWKLTGKADSTVDIAAVNPESQ
jgi:general secretion pathway protein H